MINFTKWQLFSLKKVRGKKSRHNCENSSQFVSCSGFNKSEKKSQLEMGLEINHVIQQ